TTWENQEAAFTNIAQGIRAAVTEMLNPPTSRATADMQPATSPSVMWQPLPQPALRILHLSDLHLTASDDPIVRLQPLLADLRDKEGGFGFERLDYLVLSGDLTNRATPEEFDKIYQLISRLIERFDLSAERCIIVPGNHYLSWDEQVYEWKQGRFVDPQTLPAGSFVLQGKVYLV